MLSLLQLSVILLAGSIEIKKIDCLNPLTFYLPKLKRP